MALADSLSRLGSAGAAMLHQRLELAALDVEEELLRLLVAGAVAAGLLGALTLAALAALVVVLFWDTARVAALMGVALAFGGLTALAAWRLARAMADKPPFLAATLEELANDRRELP